MTQCQAKKTGDNEQIGLSPHSSSQRHVVDSVRGALLTKGPDSSFAEAHSGFSSEPIHVEDVVKDQEDEVHPVAHTVVATAWVRNPTY